MYRLDLYTVVELQFVWPIRRNILMIGAAKKMAIGR